MPWTQISLQFSQGGADRKGDGWRQLRQHQLQLIAVDAKLGGPLPVRQGLLTGLAFLGVQGSHLSPAHTSCLRADDAQQPAVSLLPGASGGRERTGQREAIGTQRQREPHALRGSQRSRNRTRAPSPNRGSSQVH